MSVTYTEVAKDYTDLLGQKADVLVKTDDNSKVYGIYPTDDNTVAIKTTIGQLSELKTADKTFEVNGDKTKYDAAIKVYDAKGNASANTVANLMRDNGTYNTASTVYLVFPTTVTTMLIALLLSPHRSLRSLMLAPLL